MIETTHQVIHGDCLEVTGSMPAGSVDCIITDPPYGINKGLIAGDENTDVFLKSIPKMYSVLK